MSYQSKKLGPKSDSLSRYFKDLDDLDDSDADTDDDVNDGDGVDVGRQSSSETEEKEEIADKQINKSLISSTTVADQDANRTKIESKLPSASECLKSTSNPSFLNLNQQKELNWDLLEKKADGDLVEAVTDFKTNAVPPPTSYDPVLDPGIKVVDSEGRKRKTMTDDLADQMTSTKAYKVDKDEES